jgi:hypothetical protein
MLHDVPVAAGRDQAPCMCPLLTRHVAGATKGGFESHARLREGQLSEGSDRQITVHGWGTRIAMVKASRDLLAFLRPCCMALASNGIIRHIALVAVDWEAYQWMI